jgi:hypothetical protein
VREGRKTYRAFSQSRMGMTGTEQPPGMILIANGRVKSTISDPRHGASKDCQNPIYPFRFSHPPLIPPQCFSISSCSGILISSSTTHGLLTCPLMQKSFVPWFLSRPKPANHEPPRRAMVGATATVSTLATVEGHPKRPTSAGKGGLRRGLPCLPSIDSIRAVSSPQM